MRLTTIARRLVVRPDATFNPTSGCNQTRNGRIALAANRYSNSPVRSPFSREHLFNDLATFGECPLCRGYFLYHWTGDEIMLDGLERITI
jgi:hypothetical protein